MFKHIIKKFFYLCIGYLLLMGLSISFAEHHALKNKIEHYFDVMCVDGKFSGNILIAIHGKIIFEKSCGFANRSFDIQNNLKTKFNLGSMGKLFTSIAIAQLIQANKVSLDEQAYQIIPSWLPNQKDKKNNVGQLLAHTSGLGNYMDDQRWKLGADSGRYVTVNDYKPLILNDKRLYTPGQSQSYSNNGYVLLGAIIESLSHTSYQHNVQQHIFDAAGMKDTGTWPLDEPIKNRAEGYFQGCIHKKCRWLNNNFQVAFIGSPAGGGYSTIADLFRFSQALHSKKLLNKKLTKQIFSSITLQTPGKSQIKSLKIGGIAIQENMTPYGFAGAWNKFGFAIWENPLLVGHNGGTKGVSTLFATSPNNQYTIIILSNIDGSGPIQLYKGIRKILGFSTEIINY